MVTLFPVPWLLALFSVWLLSLQPSDVPLQDAREFVGSFDFIAKQDYPNGNTRNDTLSYYFGKEKTAIVIHTDQNQPDMRMVFDRAEATITALFEMKGKKGGYVLPMGNEYWPGMRHAFAPENAAAVQEPAYPAGDAKSIEGYPCRKVLAESSDYHAELWITDEIPLSMLQVLSYQSVGAGKSQKELEQFDQFGVEELPLEMYLTSKNGKANVSIYLKNFHETVSDSIFSKEGHTLSKLN